MGVGLRPSTFSAGGSLIDDQDVLLTRARFVLYDFEGKADDTVLCFQLTMKDTDGNEHIQYYSAGNKEYFMPSEDPKHPDESGKELVKVGDKENVNGGTNFAIFATSLVNAGFDESMLDGGDISAVEGTAAHVNRVPQPKRSGLVKRPGQSEREQTILIVTSLIDAGKFNGGGKAAAGKSGATKPVAGAKASVAQARSAPATPKPAPASDELTEELAGELIGLFAAKDVTSMKKVDVVKGLFQTVDKANPNKNKLLQAAGKDEVLSALDGFSLDGGVLAQQ